MSRPDLSAFLGLWLLERAIDDLRAGQRARLVGTARFTAAPEGLLYCEEGLLELPAQPPIRAERRYLWRQSGAQITVLFEDGRPFHAIAPEPAPRAHHDCAPDSYDVRYDFAHWPQWAADWRVHGPRKDYCSQSRYWRAQ